MRTSDIRQKFLAFFESQGHTVVPSAPLIPQDDPTLLFVNAGMVPFKNVFTGLERRAYNRAASAQKCVRAGGKHNDLENVGFTARHHTFFEMLGNFSFGDYFKEEAIHFAWTLMTKEFGISPARLCVTVYAEDTEAKILWQKIAGLPAEKIIPIATSDNFWSMGESGPCGPCTEIFYDHGAHIPGGPPGSADQDGDRFVEIWNLVFMQYDQQPGGRILLPKPSIDTGMGLERIAAVLQGVYDNYDTDILKALMERALELIQVESLSTVRASLKVLADHVRSASFLIADGTLPSNEGRGYVLRRILRRAMRHSYVLGARDPLLVHLVPVLVDTMGDAYPELRRAKALIATTLDGEERRFQQTLEHGLHLLASETGRLPEGAVLPGAVAFKLYDTYGFPLDLTEDILKEQGRGLDLQGFEAAMVAQKALARASWVGSGEQGPDTLYMALGEELSPSTFVGYDRESGEGQVLALLRDGARTDHMKAGQAGEMIVDQTPFYGESGGQQGDTGTFANGSVEGIIRDTQKRGGLFVHQIEVTSGDLSLKDTVTLTVESARRARLRANHSATHLLHQALRALLGPHVTQRGSLVTPDKLRFDFNHPSRLTAEELWGIEQAVNQEIRANHPVVTRLMTQEMAHEAGALALFGEKYGDDVRVVSMGTLEDGRSPVSIELCGGTHVAATGDIGLFKIIGEASVASGVRRIEALVGAGAEAYVHDYLEAFEGAARLLKTTPSKLGGKIEDLLSEKRTLSQELQPLRAQQIGTQEGATCEVLSSGTQLLIQEVRGGDLSSLKRLMDQSKRTLGDGVIFLASGDGEKTSLLLGVAGKAPYDACVLLNGLLAPYQRKGGGRADLAQGGLPEAASFGEMAAELKKRL